MLYNIYNITLVLLLCGVIYCSPSSEKRDVEARFSGIDERFEKIEKDIQSINEAVVQVASTLMERTPESSKQRHDMEKREVISGNPSLADLRGPPGKDGRDGKDGVSGGAVYTRWGGTTCGSDSTLLYSGYAGGSNYDQPGGGVNYQCMPLDPQYNRFYDVTGNWLGAYMAGVEYQSFTYGIFPDSSNDQNVPCARCHTNNRSALMMIPAKRDCSEGWNKEYEGYLMTEWYNRNHQTTFECVDASPKYIKGEGANTNGGVLYFVRTQCDRGGHCPPYDDNKQITCVVCSK